MQDTIALREYQKNVIDFVTASVRLGGSAAVEAPTGSGKTIMGLISALNLSDNGARKILYLTRTNSQQEQVISELRKIGKSFGVKAVALQGRTNLCALYKEVEDSADFTAESLSRFCSLRKRKVMSGDTSACRYFNDTVRSKAVQGYLFDNNPTAEEFFVYAKENGFCAYESLKFSLKDANMVIAPYALLLNPVTSGRLIYNWGVSRNQLIVILDEAHNLPDIAREFASFSVSVNQLNMAERESTEFGDFELMQRVRTSDFIEMLRNAISDLVRDKIGESGEARIRFDEFREYMMIENSMNSEKYHSLVDYMSIFGDYIAEKREKDGKVPRTVVLSVADRLRAWETLDDEVYAAIVSKDRLGTIEAVCLDPSKILDPLRESWTIHMSGTLDPIEVYKNVTGFPEMTHMIVPYIFPEENRKIVYDGSMTTKYDEFDEREASKMHDMIENLITKVGRNTIVFFPSYSTMEKVTSQGFEFSYFSERRDIDQGSLMEMIRKFRAGKSAIFAVSGGRMSEGMNFPGVELEMVIIAGIPYPRPDARHKAIMEYYERKYGNGWLYSVIFPTAIKMKQAIGRLIRNENDRGMAVILDRRAASFKKYMPGLELSTNPEKTVSDFFSR
ncbi:ATP-dependent DNA helicase [Thermoplasmatales archaeon]|nr:ATP-dependent DNA helicase [Thermoplasmatales archaeon]